MITVGGRICKKCLFNLGTHNGIFHCDEVVAIAILRLSLSYLKNLHVVRSEDIEVLNKCKIVIDIGGGSYDHHGKNFKKCRSTGEEYASAGLVWENFAEKAIRTVTGKIGVYLEDDEVKKIKEEIDTEFIIPIDLEDNGIEFRNHAFSFITQLRPRWIEHQNFDEAFIKAEALAFDMLKAIIKSKAANLRTAPYFNKSLSIHDGIFELPAQTMKWEEYIVNHNLSNNYEIKFVIFPYPRGGWAAQSVPPSMDEIFKQLVPFPEEWAGENKDTLPEISGVKEAILCHKDRFFARAQSKAAIIQMCKIAMGLF